MASVKNFKRYTILTTASVVAFLGMGLSSAEAGFEWVPAEQNNSGAYSYTPQPAPADANAPAVRPSAPAPASAPTYQPAPLTPSDEDFSSPMLPTPITAPPAYDSQASHYEPPRAPAAREDYSYTPPAPPAVSTPAPSALERRADNPRVVMPDDAPDSARLNISAYPEYDAQDATIMDKPVIFREPTSPTTSTPASSNFTEAVGFGSDVPLALALRQVVPANFAFSFSPDIDPGYRVSWDGGKPWNEVVDAMIAPLGYKAVITGRTVHIKSEKTSAVDIPSMNTSQASATPQSLIEPAAGDVMETSDYSPEAINVAQIASEIAAIEPSIGEEDIAAGDDDVKPLFLLSETNEPIVDTDNATLAEQDVQRLTVKDPGQSIQASQPEEALENITRFKGSDFYAALGPQAAIETDAGQEFQTWRAVSGDSLKETLARWSTEAGTQLIWDASYDYDLDADIFIRGSLRDAVDGLLAASVKDGEEKPMVDFVRDAKTAQIYVKDRV